MSWCIFYTERCLFNKMGLQYSGHHFAKSSTNVLRFELNFKVCQENSYTRCLRLFEKSCSSEIRKISGIDKYVRHMNTLE